jgi:8-amino-7-oxononanoate synthase
MYEEKLSEIRGKSLFRSVRDRQSSQGRVVVIGGRRLVNFSSNDYLGLAADEALKGAAREALERYGAGAGASRLLSGGCGIHAALEDEIARFKGAQGAVLFNSGYAANVGAIPALAPEGSAIFSDALNHASIIDGCRLSRAEVFIYRHNDTAHLEKLLLKSGHGGATPGVIKRKIIISESVFGMDGDIALLPRIYELCKRHGAVLYVDEAHATGVLGAGRGALAHFGIGADPDVVQMGTLSKAAGAVGGFIAGSEEVVEYLVNTARTFIYSTALPAADAAASLAALRLIAAGPELIRKLARNTKKCRGLLKRAGFDVAAEGTPIIPVVFGTVRQTLKAASALMERGVHAPAIRPPTVKTPRIRVTVTAAHTDEDLKILAEALKEAKGCKGR